MRVITDGDGQEPLASWGTTAGNDLQQASKAVLDAFNTWSFKRQQPTEPERLLSFASRAVERAEPVRFVLYWGKGPRSGVSEPEIACLGFLSKMVNRIQECHPPGAQVTLIATDTHADHNGHHPSETSRYFSEMASAAGRHGFDLVSLKLIVARYQSRIPPVSQEPDARIRGELTACAQKWYKGGMTTAEGALKYYLMNMLEKQAVELAFPWSIFITFNGANYRSIFPDKLPVFYMYSIRKGTSEKPWFIDPGRADLEQPRDRTSESRPLRTLFA